MNLDGMVPPHDLGAEQALIGACMLSLEAAERVMSVMRPEDCYSESHRRVLEAVEGLCESNTPPDSIAVATWLKDHGRLQQIGGIAYLSNLLGAAPAIALSSVDGYARTVREKARLRALIRLCQESAAKAHLPVEDARSFVEQFESGVSELGRSMRHGRGATSAADAIRTVMREVFDAKSDPGPPSGIANFDAALDLRPGEYSVFGGSTGHGKTALGLTLAGNVALRGGGVLYVATADLKAPQLMMRLLCSWAGVWASKVRRKQLSPYDMTALTRAVQKFDRLPLLVDDAHGQTIQAIGSSIRREADVCERNYKAALRLVVIDYVQACKLLGATARQTEEQQLKAVSEAAHAMAVKHKVHVVGLVQTHPLVPNAKEGDGKPDLQHIKGCKAIAHPAENVAFVHREKQNGKYPPRGPAELVVRKCRWGSAEPVPLIFDGPLTRFEDDPDRPMTPEGA